MKAPLHSLVEGAGVPPGILHYYEAIEKASAEMVEAARAGHWDDVVKLEGACMVLIGQLKLAAREAQLDAETRRAKSRIMQRILVNDAEIRHLAEPWINDLSKMMGSKIARGARKSRPAPLIAAQPKGSMSKLAATKIMKTA